jgi:hypothetical protein
MDSESSNKPLVSTKWSMATAICQIEERRDKDNLRLKQIRRSVKKVSAELNEALYP